MKRNYIKVLSNQLTSQNKPIIFWDTCSLLDILRLPYRRDRVCFLNNYIKIKEEIIANNIISVTSELVFLEYQDHFQEVYRECENEIGKIKSKIDYYAKFLKEDYSNTDSANTIPLNLQNIVDDIWNKTHVILRENSFAKFAHIRTISKLPPAHKKGEYKDCYIWGTCLQLAKCISTHNILFFSTNTTDYFLDDNMQSNSQLKIDCNAHNNVKIKRNCGEIIGELNL